MNIEFNKSTVSTVIKDKNIFDRNIFDVSYSWDFNRCLKSVDMEEELFINFFSGKKDPLYKFIKKEFTWLFNNNDKILQRFKIKPIYDSKYYDKLRSICYETCCIKYGYLSNVFRLRHNGNKGFQLYYMINKKEIIFLVIDIYHLMIPAHDNSFGDGEKDALGIYNKNKGKDFGLDNLLQIIEN